MTDYLADAKHWLANTRDVHQGYKSLMECYAAAQTNALLAIAEHLIGPPDAPENPLDTPEYQARTEAVLAAGLDPAPEEAEQPTPQVGDIWEGNGDRLTITRVIINRFGVSVAGVLLEEDRKSEPEWSQDYVLNNFRLVERDGKPWPSYDKHVQGVESPTQTPHNSDEDGEPADDDQIRWAEDCVAHGIEVGRDFLPKLIARVRQEQARVEYAEAEASAFRESADLARTDEAEVERIRAEAAEHRQNSIELVNRLSESQERAHKATTRAVKAEAEVARMRPVVDAAIAWRVVPTGRDDKEILALTRATLDYECERGAA